MDIQKKILQKQKHKKKDNNIFGQAQIWSKTTMYFMYNNNFISYRM
jgi:hypothetical protein